MVEMQVPKQFLMWEQGRSRREVPRIAEILQLNGIQLALDIMTIDMADLAVAGIAVPQAWQCALY